MTRAIDPFEEFLRKKKVEMLEEQYQLTDVGSVDCPPTPSLSFEKGATFECTVVVGGEERTVEVSVLNEEGGIQVSEPK